MAEPPAHPPPAPAPISTASGGTAARLARQQPALGKPPPVSWRVDVATLFASSAAQLLNAVATLRRGGPAAGLLLRACPAIIFLMSLAGALAALCAPQLYKRHRCVDCAGNERQGGRGGCADASGACLHICLLGLHRPTPTPSHARRTALLMGVCFSSFLLPCTRNPSVGTALVLHRPAQPGAKGAAVDLLRLLTGTDAGCSAAKQRCRLLRPVPAPLAA